MRTRGVQFRHWIDARLKISLACFFSLVLSCIKAKTTNVFEICTLSQSCPMRIFLLSLFCSSMCLSVCLPEGRNNKSPHNRFVDQRKDVSDTLFVHWWRRSATSRWNGGSSLFIIGALIVASRNKVNKQKHHPPLLVDWVVVDLLFRVDIERKSLFVQTSSS